MHCHIMLNTAYFLVNYEELFIEALNFEFRT